VAQTVTIIEQDHRFIKKITKPMMGFKAFHSAQATIAGIETAHMIRKGQLSEEKFLPLAWAGMPKTSFRKNSDSPLIY
jgi:transposase-like protein